MLERDLEKKLVEEVKKLGGVAYKFVSPGNVGVPDRLVLLPGGKIFFVELKTETGQLSKLQTYQTDKISELGQDVYIVHGRSGLDKMVRIMQEKMSHGV